MVSRAKPVNWQAKCAVFRVAPNKSLHRTPAAALPSPVSSKPLGDEKRPETAKEGQ